MTSFSAFRRRAVLVWLAASLAAGAQSPLSLRQAIDDALHKNPDTRAAHAGIDAAHADASLSRTQLFPQLNFTEDISRGNDPVYVFGGKLRQQRFSAADFDLNALNRPQPIGNFTTRFSGSWMAFDSFRTQKMIHGADLMEKSAASAANAEDQKVIFGVVQSFQGVLFAEREVAVAQHEQETADALLSSVNDRVKAGLAVESDRMSAEVNAAACKQGLIAAQGDLELAWAQLRIAMGMPDLQESKLQPIEEHAYPASGALADEVDTARKTRPDLMAAGDAQAAQASAVSAAKYSFGPRISAYGNWEQDRPTFAGSGGNNWAAGVQIGIDIMPFSKRAQLAHERAAKERADAQVAGYEQQVRLQVEQAHIRRQTAQLTLETARAAIQQSAESLRILRNRYDAGLATITDLLRAEDAERQSQANYWHAVYGNATAYAQLLFATGRLTPDAAEVLQ